MSGPMAPGTYARNMSAGRSTSTRRSVTMKSLAVLAFRASASVAMAQPPPREQFQDGAVTVKGEIVWADMSASGAKLHIVEAVTGKAWVVEGPSSNTLVRGGL